MRKILFLGLLAGLPMTMLATAARPPAPCTNDALCDAVDLGLLADTAGLADISIGPFENTCATNANEPTPSANGYWFNDAGVWFRFTTGDDPSPLIFIEGLSDPATGLDLELAVYRSIAGRCTNPLRFEGAISPAGTLDATLPLFCPRPNTTYFILVDGDATGTGALRGAFELRVREVETADAPDTPCGAEDLGAVPVGGQLMADGVRSNFCATSQGDPPVSKFATQVTVWFRFQAPPSGHVFIEALSTPTIYPLGVQLALFRAPGGRCTGPFEEVASAFTSEDTDERLEASCLTSGETYYILIDGFGSGGRGMFTLSVADAGDNTPRTQLDTVLCAGDSLRVGPSVYTAGGSYVDTLRTAGGCDSIVLTTLRVLDPVTLQLDQYRPAVWNGPPGAALAGAAGGAGGYAFRWCDGSTGERNERLPAGGECCVSVTDARGCAADTCFTTAFITRIISGGLPEPARCHGDSTGQIRFAAGNGIAPYQYQWRHLEGLLRGQGALDRDSAVATLSGLPAGRYEVRVADAFGDTTFIVVVGQPEPLRFEPADVRNASCFGVCDGTVEVAVAGGAGGYRFSWDGAAQASARREALCAGEYSVTVVDTNSCTATQLLRVAEPPLFTAAATEQRPVSCFQGSDGAATVVTNGQPLAYRWSTGRDSATISGLPAGEYRVTVTNSDGCLAEAAVRVTQPEAPLTVRVEVVRPISCYGAADGELAAVAAGPYEQLDVRWSDGITRIEPAGLAAGIYSVVVTNERGCRAERRYVLTAPEPLRAEVVARDITCLDPGNGGEIRLVQVGGGRPGYEFSLDGIVFQPSPAFGSLFAGEYGVIVRDRAGCEASFPATVQGPPELVVDLGEDQTLQLGDSIRLEARANSNNLVYSWSPAAPAGNPSAFFVRPLVSTAYRVEVRDTVNFCTAFDVVRLTVRRERRVFVPNAFSPDGDGRNDRLVIFGGAGTERIRSFRVFDRGGALIYEDADFAPNDDGRGWDGFFRGRAMPAGVYVYLAKIEFFDGAVELFRGDVSLIR